MYGFLGPARMPASLVERLHQEIVRALNRADTRERIECDGSYEYFDRTFRCCDGFRMPAHTQANHGHRGPVFESRQGTKSRGVGHPVQRALWRFRRRGPCRKFSSRPGVMRQSPPPAILRLSSPIEPALHKQRGS